MKTIKLSCAIADMKDMNELVDTICEITGNEKVSLRDKFKMVTKANSKTLGDLCKHLKLRMEFDYSGKKNMVTVFLEVKNNFMAETNSPEELTCNAPGEDYEKDDDTDDPF